jgi:hypothetical protein
MLIHATAAHAQGALFGYDLSGNLVLQTNEYIGPPQIIGQPQRQVVMPGQLASFFVVVADSASLTYQWQINYIDIPGATNDTLLLTNVSTNNEGLYSVVLNNGTGISGIISSFQAPLMIDSRGCGMPDSWQMTYFGNLTNNATGDFDGDGVPNLQEFLDGTDPTNAASALYRIALFSDGGTVVAVPDMTAYTKGQVVTLTAIGSGAAPFHAWTGDVLTQSNSITLTMTNNKTLFARFTPVTFQWASAVSGDWNVASNWTPNLVPGANDSVVIASPVTVTLNTDSDVTDFALGTATAAAELTGTGALTIHGTGLWVAGTMSGTGSTAVAPGASLNIFNGNLVNLSSRTLENGGTVSLTGSGGIGMNAGVITNDVGGVFSVSNPISFLYAGNFPRFDNAGTFVNAISGGTTTFGQQVGFNNYGAVILQGGTFSMGGGGVHAGTATVPVGTTIIFAGGTFTSSGNPSITGAGTLVVSGGTATLAGTVNVSGSNVFNEGSVDFTGDYTCTNNAMIISGDATANFDGTGTVSPSLLNLSGGSLGGSGTVTVGGVMNWTGGSMTGNGWTVIAPGATLNLGSGTLTLTSRTLDNGGTALGSGTILYLDGCVITNETGALFQIQSPVTLNNERGFPRFDNAGTFLTAAGGGTTTFGLQVGFNNYGTVNIQGGTVVAYGGFVCAPSAVLTCALAGTMPGVNYGQLQVFGTAALNGTLSVNFTNHYIPTTNDSFTVLTVSSLNGTAIINGTFANFIYPSNKVSMLLSNTATSVIVRTTDILPVPQPQLLPPQLSGSNITLIWTSVPNMTYRAEFNPNLAPSNWNPLSGDVIAVTNMASKLDTLASSNRFYRVRVVP